MDDHAKSVLILWGPLHVMVVSDSFGDFRFRLCCRKVFFAKCGLLFLLLFLSYLFDPIRPFTARPESV